MPDDEYFIQQTHTKEADFNLHAQDKSSKEREQRDD